MNRKWIAPLALVTGAGAVAIILAAQGTTTALPDSFPVAASSDELGAPATLPASATLVRVTRDAPTGGPVVREYSLAGKANSNTVTPQALALTPKSVHPATTLTVYYIPGLSDPDIPVDPVYFDRTSVDVNGSTGALSIPKSGLGAHRVDWVDSAGDYHVVMSERLQTPDGISGLASDELLRIARSVR
jgi:hypothetical protein